MREVQPCAREHSMRPTALEPEPPPAIAEVGSLCSACFYRLSWRIAEAADVLAHVRASVVPDLGRSDAPKVSGSRDPRLPFNGAAVDLGDLLWAAMINWATSAARAMGIHPPAVLAEILEHDADAVAVPSWLSPQELAERLRPVAQWLEDLLESIAYLPFAADMHDEIVELVAKGKTLAGLTPRRKVRQRKRECPLCGEISVEVTWAGEWPRVACASCGHAIPVEWEVMK